MSPQVLDATAGNRSIWRTKADPRVLFIDAEPELEIPPDKVLDCTDTGFPDKSFHTIIFDPPHSVNQERGSGYMTCPNKSYLKPHWKVKQPCYYGNDVFQTKVGLLEFIIKASREVHRLLQDDGCLWIKWGERHAALGEIVTLLHREGYQEMLRIAIRQHNHPYSHGAYWVMLMKKEASQ